VQAYESLVFLCLYKDVDAAGNVTYVPIAIPFAKSKHRKGVAWLQLVQRACAGGKPMYCAQYLITTMIEKGKRGTYYNFDVDFSPNPITAEDYAQAKEAFTEFDEMYRQRKLRLAQEEQDAAPDAEIVGPAGGPVPGASGTGVAY
jgi:hypothetical protein